MEQKRLEYLQKKYEKKLNPASLQEGMGAAGSKMAGCACSTTR